MAAGFFRAAQPSKPRSSAIVISPADFALAPLIAFAWERRHPKNATPARCFAAAGIDAPAEPPLPTFSDESHATQAAMAAKGAALPSLRLVADEIAAGRLVQPFGPVIDGLRHTC